MSSLSLNRLHSIKGKDKDTSFIFARKINKMPHITPKVVNSYTTVQNKLINMTTTTENNAKEKTTTTKTKSKAKSTLPEQEKLILDTNVILHDFNCLNNFEENDIYIPFVVLEELDKFKRERPNQF